MRISNKQKILFIAHDASRSGGPIVLLNFLRWLKNNGNAEFDILLLKDGPLKKDFEELTVTYLVPFKYKYSLQNKVRRRLHPELSDSYKISEVVNSLSKKEYDVIFGNTIVSLPWLVQFKKLINIKTVCSMHELSNVIEYYFKKRYVIEELSKIDLIIAGSHAVSNNLVEDFTISAEKIKVVHAFITTEVNILKTKENLRQELGIKNNELVIGGMSLIELRKGIDLIIPLARELKNKYPEVLFKIIWVGGSATDNFIQIIKKDAKKCEVESDVIFIEATLYPDDYINLYDVFVLLSREDPFPLVLLSAAYMQKAIIAFEKSGGSQELLNDGAGFLAPYLRIEEVAKIISNLYHNPNLLIEAGKKARKKVESEFNADVIPARLFKILQDL